MGNTILITLKGRKSGKSITTPVNYCRSGETLRILSERSRNWWRNITPGSPVTVRLHGRDAVGTADLVLDEIEIAEHLRDYVQQLPVSARSLGIKLVHGIPDRQDMARVAPGRVFVKVCLQDSIP